MIDTDKKIEWAKSNIAVKLFLHQEEALKRVCGINRPRTGYIRDAVEEKLRRDGALSDE